MNSAYDIALSHLGLMPVEFWSLTPGETADLFLAFRTRENRRLMTEAWKLSYLISDKAAEGREHELAPAALFKRMPGAFPDDIPNLRAAEAASAGLTPEQLTERERRMNKVKRVQR